MYSPTRPRRALRGARQAACAALAGLLLLGVAGVQPSHAMRVSPMVSEITTKGAGSSARIEVQNVGRAALPFEVRVTKIDYDLEGNLTETPADENFLVFPPQGLVAVGGRQVVRAQWVGAPDLDHSEAYFVAIQQLPVDLEAAGDRSPQAQIQVVYHMKALVTVAPPGVEPKVEVLSASPAMVTPAAPNIDPSLSAGAPPPPAPEAVPGVEVRVRNTGKRYAIMSGANWIIEGTGPDGSPAEVRLTGEQVGDAVGVGYLAPINGERVFKLPTGIAFAADKPVKVRFTQ